MSNTSYETRVRSINKAMVKFGAGKDWLTVLDVTDTITADDIKDNIHLYPESYKIFVDALDEAGIEIADK